MPPFPPLKYFVPNTFTALSLLLGLASVVASAQGAFALAAWMILWGTLLDKADGTAARLLGATSKFGVEFDSFADFVSFGVAPAALFYFRLGGVSSGPLAGVAAGLYAVALAVRLSRFNVMNAESSIFYGAPGTMMGGWLASGYLACDHYGLVERLLPGASALLIVSAFLMVSTLRLPKLKMGSNKALNALMGVCVLASYVLAPLRLLPELLFAMASTFMVGGFIAGARMPPDQAGSTPPEPDLGAA